MPHHETTRVYILARELDVSDKKILDVASRLKLDVRNQLSRLTVAQCAAITEELRRSPPNDLPPNDPPSGAANRPHPKKPDPGTARYRRPRRRPKEP